NGATLSVELNGTAAGSGYDQVLVTSGGIILSNSTLSVTLGYTPSLGDKFTIISNAPNSAVLGTFSGLAEGDYLAVGASSFQITYLGNGGNDVVLVATPEPSTAALCGIGLLGLVVVLRHRRSGHRS